MVAIQVRDVPESVRDTLAAAAAQRGVSLQTHLRELLEHEAKTARNRAWLARVREQGPVAWVTPDAEPAAETIRRQRDERTQHLLDTADQGNR